MSRSPHRLLTLALAVAGFQCACSRVAGQQDGPTLGDPARGQIIAGRQACGSCHTIPGLMQADGVAGPPLKRFGARTVIAGVLPNTPDNLARWLKSPETIVPGNAMPDMGLSDQQARDVAAFVEKLR